MTDKQKVTAVLETKELEAIAKLPEGDRAAAMKALTEKVNSDVTKLIGKAMEETKVDEAKKAAETTTHAPENTAEHPAQHIDPNHPAPPTPEEAEQARLDAEQATADQAAADHPAALTGKQKVGTFAAVTGTAGLAAAVANSVPLLTSAGLHTTPWALNAYTTMQAGVQSLPLIGQWIPVGGGALSTLGATAMLAPVAAAGLGVVGKAVNMGIRVFNPEHQSTGLNPFKNMWYGAKVLTSPVWGSWEGLKWIGRTARENIPGLATTSVNRTGHEMRNAAKWGLGGAVGLAAASTVASGGIVPAGLAVGAGIGYGGNLAYRVWNRLVNREGSTLPSSGNGHAAAASHPVAAHAEPDHHMAA